MRSVMVVTSSKSGSNSNGVMYKEEGLGKVNGDGNEGSVDDEDKMWSMRPECFRKVTPFVDNMVKQDDVDMLEHPIVHVIKEHRTLAKLLNCTLGSIHSLAKLSMKTQRYTLHAHWLQTSTATGRLSMEDPNLQVNVLADMELSGIGVVMGSCIQSRYVLGKKHRSFVAWLPAANALLEMMILHLPSPCTSKKYHVEILYEASNESGHFFAFGLVFSCIVSPSMKIAMFDKNGGVQALIQYPDVQTNMVAKEALEGHCIYDGGFCKLRISYSRHTDLSIKIMYGFWFALDAKVPLEFAKEVTNAARNYEILHERDDDDVERPEKRQKSGDRHQRSSMRGMMMTLSDQT
nr:polypyrimidine tract-binding protein homolog 2 isoform X2 [Tanacetum cinerariifolium]